MNNQIIVPEGTANALSALSKMTPAEIFVKDGMTPIYDAIHKEVSNILPDITTKKGRDEVAALAYKVARSKTFIDKVGEVFNSDLKKKTKAVDAERKIMWDKLEALQAEVRRPLTEWEEKEKARTDAHKTAFAEVEILPQFSEPPTIEQIKARIERGLELSNRDWEEHKELATDVLFKSAHTLGTMLIAAEKAVADAAELESLRKAQADRDAKDAADALASSELKRKQETEELVAKRAEEARAAAEQKAKDDAVSLAAKVESDKKAAADKAACEAQEAAEALKKAELARLAAVKKAEEDAAAAERKRVSDIEEAVRKEQERIATENKKVADEAAARENDRAHHAKVNNEVLKAISKILQEAESRKSLGAEADKLLVEAIVRKQIPHVTISY